MKILRFRASGVHGFMSYDVRLDRDLTFITGINGSGKTSVLHCIIALISPSLPILSNLKFADIEIEVEHDQRKLTISARQSDGQTTLSVSHPEASLTFKKYIPDDEIPAYQQAENETEYYRELTSRNANSDVLTTISSLPTPMFLGLDRRARFQEVAPARYPVRASRMGRNIFGATASISIRDAIALVETTYRDMLIAAGRLGEDQRRDMLLELLNMRIEGGGFLPFTAPTPAEMRLLKSVKVEVSSLPEILGLPREQVDSRLRPYLNELQDALDAIPRDIEIEILLRDHESAKTQRIVQAMMFWNANKPGLKRLQTLTEQAIEFNEKKKVLVVRAQQYLDAVNSFLGDSGKTVRFDESGYIAFVVEGTGDARELSTLSSGEAQLFVILTHLFFHPQAQTANVFIIDEPELSLHVQWQEMLVESMRRANPSVQYILATHSPSIILDKIKHCRDISPKVPSRA